MKVVLTFEGVGAEDLDLISRILELARSAGGLPAKGDMVVAPAKEPQPAASEKGRDSWPIDPRIAAAEERKKERKKAREEEKRASRRSRSAAYFKAAVDWMRGIEYTPDIIVRMGRSDCRKRLLRLVMGSKRCGDCHSAIKSVGEPGWEKAQRALINAFNYDPPQIEQEVNGAIVTTLPPACKAAGGQPGAAGRGMEPAEAASRSA